MTSRRGTGNRLTFTDSVVAIAEQDTSSVSRVTVVILISLSNYNKGYLQCVVLIELILPLLKC